MGIENPPRKNLKKTESVLPRRGQELFFTTSEETPRAEPVEEAVVPAVETKPTYIPSGKTGEAARLELAKEKAHAKYLKGGKRKQERARRAAQNSTELITEPEVVPVIDVPVANDVLVNNSEQRQAYQNRKLDEKLAARESAPVVESNQPMEVLRSRIIPGFHVTDLSENSAAAGSKEEQERSKKQKDAGDAERLERIKLDREAELVNVLSPSMERVLTDKTSKETKSRFNTLMMRAKNMFGDKAGEVIPTTRARQQYEENVTLGKSDKQIQSVNRTERIKDERWAYKNLESKYLDAYAEHLKKSPVERIRNELFKTEDTIELKKLKDEYYAARLNFLRQFEDKKRHEIEENQEKVYDTLRKAREANKSITDEELDAIRESESKKLGLPEAIQKANGEISMERVLLTKNFLEQRNKARAEQFSYGQKLGFGKLASWTKKRGEDMRGFADKYAPYLANVKIGPKTAKVLRSVLIATAIVGVSTSATVGSLPITLLLVGGIATKSIAFGIVAAGIGGAAGKIYKKFGREVQQDAKGQVSNYGDLESWSGSSLSKKDKEYKKLESRSTEETLQRKTAWVDSGVTVAVSLLLGGVFSASDIEGMVSHLDKLAPMKELGAMVGGGEAVHNLTEHTVSAAKAVESTAHTVNSAAEAQQHVSEAAHHVVHAAHAEQHHQYYEHDKLHPADIDENSDMEAQNVKTAELNHEQAEAARNALAEHKAELDQYEQTYSHPSPEVVDAPAPVEAPVETPSVPETPHPVETPSSSPEYTAPAESTANIIHNLHNLDLDPAKADLFKDANGNLVAFGGSVEDKIKLATEYVANNHDVKIFFDSSSVSADGQTVHHLSRVDWNSDLGQIQVPNESMDPSLGGLPLPTPNDLVSRVDITK